MTIRKSIPFFSFIPGLSVMDRYIITELIPPFLFGMGMFSSVGVTIGSLFDLMRRAVDEGLPATLVLKVLLLSLPQFMAYAFPTSVLLATLLTYSRLSSDSELIALRSCGVSIYRLVLPAILLSFIVTGVTFGFNEYVVPASNYQATLTLEKALGEEKPTFKERNIFYREYSQEDKTLKRLFYAQQFDGERMKGLTILDWSQQGLNQIVTANSAIWNIAQSTWDFYNGTIYLVAPDASYRNIVRFEHQQLQLPRIPLDLARKDRDYDEMNITQARERLELERQSGDEDDIRKLKIRINQKFALPFACVVFGLVGGSLGNRPQRTSKATGFGISVLVIFAYYMLMAIGDALGLSNYLPPLISAWLPNLMGFAVGGFLLIRAAR